MKNPVPCFLMLLASIFYNRADAQPEYTTTNFTHNLAPFKVSLTLAGMENILTPVTAGVLIEGQLKDRLFYNVQFRQGFIRNFLIAPSKLITTQKESKGTVFEAGTDWSFSEKTKKGRVRVTTSRDLIYNDKYILEKYFMADCEVRRSWAFSGGVIFYQRPRYVNSDSSMYIISGDEDIRAPRDGFTHFNQTTLGAYAGLAKRKIRKALVNSAGLNHRVHYSVKFYAHAFVGSTAAGDIVYNNLTFTIDNANRMPFGYRIGWQWDQMGMVTGFEFGKMPGISLKTPVKQSELSKIFSNNPLLNYARITFHINIFNGDKNYYIRN